MRALTAVPIGLLSVLSLIAPSPALAAQDIFLVISGIQGDSTDDQFKGGFDVLSVTSGITTDDSGKPTFAPLAVKVRGTSAASATLEQAAATGQKFPQAVVSLRRSGESRLVFLTYTLTDVTVRSFQRDASSGGDPPSEALSLTYARITTDYRQQNPDGSAGPVVTVCWDVKTNARCQ